MKKRNFLDFIPVINDKNTWSEDESGIVTVTVQNKGFYHFIANKLFRTPKTTHITLDEYGSFIWKSIDGKRDVCALSELLKSEYKDKADPLYNRLVKYMLILQNGGFISLINN